jgi:hypothetical protein
MGDATLCFAFMGQQRAYMDNRLQKILSGVPV